MKKIFVAIFIIFSSVVYAADKTITSKKYVDTQIATKQDKIPAVDNNTVITHTGTVGNIGEKGVYDSSGNYEEQQTALMTAGDANAGINNALENEFVCVEEDTDGTCLIWEIRPARLSQLSNTYTQLDYLESTGTQTINSEIMVTDNIGVSVKYAWTELKAQTYIFGSYNPHYYLGINSGRNAMVGSYGPEMNNVVLSIPINSVSVGTVYQYNINFYNSGTVQFVGITPVTQLAPKMFTSSSVTLGLFGLTGGIYNSKSRIYHMQITDGTTLVRNFIPVRRNSDGELGMYDLVSNQFFTNAGSGTFVAGPVASYIPQNQ